MNGDHHFSRAHLVARRTQAANRSRAELGAFGLAKSDDDKQVQAWLQTLGVASGHTNKAALAHHRDNAGVMALVNWRRLIAFLRDLGPKVLAAARSSADGRVHATFDPLGAETGRFSCENPNLLGLPKDPEVRGCIIPAPGHVFISADFQTIDLRVLADVTGDERLQAVFKRDGDPHREMAALLLKKVSADVTSDERQRAKAVGLGFAFGMGERRFVEHALAEYGVNFTVNQAREFRTAYLESHPQVAAWQRRARDSRQTEVRTKSGRRRLLSAGSYTQRLNTEVQGTAADGMKRAMVLIHERLKPFSARLVLCVHDEPLVECPAEHANTVKSIVIAAMVEGMSEFVKSVPITVTSSIRSTWAEDDALVTLAPRNTQSETPRSPV